MRDDHGLSSDARVPNRSHDAFEISPGRADRGLVLLCDHASNHIPERYGSLGMCERELGRHIAYDIGVAEITRVLSRALDVPAVLSKHSRLLIDPNRGLDDPTLIMRLSDGAIVPGNRTVTGAEREERLRLYYRPYHDAIISVIEACEAAGRPPALASIHSFTERWKDFARPWHAGVLWDADERLAGPLIAGLRSDGALVVGDNEPYSGHLEGDTLWTHGTLRGLPHALIEIRQDLIRDTAGQHAWAARLEAIFRGMAAFADLRFYFEEVGS